MSFYIDDSKLKEWAGGGPGKFLLGTHEPPHPPVSAWSSAGSYISDPASCESIPSELSLPARWEAQLSSGRLVST